MEASLEESIISSTVSDSDVIMHIDVDTANVVEIPEDNVGHDLLVHTQCRT